MVDAKCAVCATGFCARSDAVYCSPACRQKAHRARTADRVAAMRTGLRSAPVRPDVAALGRAVAGSIERAREQVDRSRQLCRTSTERLQQAADIRWQSLHGQAARSIPSGERESWPTD